MCGRYTLTVDPKTLQAEFNIPVPENLAPRYNIAPTQPVPVIVAENGSPHFDAFRWGLIPSWAKDPRIGNKLINARAETIAEKPSFRAAFRRRRCLIPADGFFEWQKTPHGKQPVFIHLKNRRPLAFAGLWERWFSPDGSEILSCTIITTAPNDLLAEVHNRMPVILPPDARNLWLDDSQSPQNLLSLLKPYPAPEMAFYPVSKLVNSPANDDPACVEPL